MAFDSLSERLSKTLRDVSGKGRLTDKNMEDMLKEVRIALLEADVNYKIVKEFLEDIRERARGEDVLNGVEPGQMLVKIVHDEIIELLGTEQAGLNFKEEGITTIMMVGLQGTGKTTSVAKIARICKQKLNRKVIQDLNELFGEYESSMSLDESYEALITYELTDREEFM